MMSLAPDDRTTKEMLAKAATVGATTALPIAAMYRGQMVTPSTGVIGRYITPAGGLPLWAVAAAAGAATSVVSDFAHDAITPMVAHSDKFGEVSSAVVAAGSAAGAGVGTYYLLDTDFLDSQKGLGVPMLAGMAAAGEYVGSQIYESYVAPMMMDAPAPMAVAQSAGGQSHDGTR